MFSLYVTLGLVPAVCFYKYINRDGDDSGGFVWAVAVAVVQGILILTGGTIAISIAVLIAAFGAFIGYGAWYMPRLEELVPIPKGEYAVFNYRDFKGLHSKRRVLVTSSDNTYIEGICSTRNAARTFKRSRVQGDIIIESTGEVIAPMAPAHPEMHRNGADA